MSHPAPRNLPQAEDSLAILPHEHKIYPDVNRVKEMIRRKVPLLLPTPSMMKSKPPTLPCPRTALSPAGSEGTRSFDSQCNGY
ncbi:hypothetical protein HZ326_0563 [Fusarium oxysporum f. sp. albedinis]|nr:hypothetical protein HZ326_0563 [Fusarium oxysporum f. sp. albedinis]